MPTKDNETQEFTRESKERRILGLEINLHGGPHLIRSDRGPSRETFSYLLAQCDPEYTSIEQSAKDAERLALCWNSHDELVEACQGFLDLLNAKVAITDIEEWAEAQKKAINKMRNAVTKATAQTQEDKK